MYSLLRALLFRLKPEVAHHFTLKTLKKISRPWLREKYLAKLPNKPVKIFGLEFKNPIGLAAGFDNNGEYIDALFGLGFGFVEVGGITPQPQPGNPKPRLYRIPEAKALINRMGFPNLGVDYLVENLKRRTMPGIVGVNIAKNKETPLESAYLDYQYCLQKVYSYVDYITINVSSPNTPGLRQLQTEQYLHDLLLKINQTRMQLSEKYNKTKPIVVKVSPDLSEEELEHFVTIVRAHSLDGVIATNTSLDHSNVEKFSHGKEQGGLSGKPIFDKSTNVLINIHKLAKNQLSIIALGGIFSANDALAKLNAGASLIQLYTGLVYRGPRLIREILESLPSKTI